MKYQDKTEMFEFEKSFCFDNLKTWQNEAHNLFYSAEVLYRFEIIKNGHLFSGNEAFSSLFPFDLTNRGYFNYRTQRMLWAYAFENLLKLIILAKIKKEKPEIKEVPFDEIRSHNLRYLARKAGIELSEPEFFYSAILEKCSVWAGRYPLPLKSDQMYDSREALPSRDALLERSKRNYEKFVNGEIPRTSSESDIVHSGIGEEEYTTYQQYKTKLFDIVERYLSDAS